MTAPDQTREQAATRPPAVVAVTSAESPAEPTPSSPSARVAAAYSSSRSLPLATGRVAAAAVAGALAVVIEWLLDGDVYVREMTSLAAGALLLVGAIMLGLRVRVLVMLALVSGGVAAALVAGVAPQTLGMMAGPLFVPAIVLGALALLYWLAPIGRSLLVEVFVLVTAAPLALAWAPFAVFGIDSLLGHGFPLPIAAAGGALVATWLASEIGRTTALSIATLFGALRTALFRTSMAIAGASASLWAGAQVETRIHGFAFGTPFESLALMSGIVVAAVMALTVIIAAWQMPKRLAIAQLRGRIDPRVVGEPLLFIAFSSMAALLAAWLDAMMSIGRASCVALAAGAAYTWCRIRYAGPDDGPNAALWIALIGGQSDSNELSNVASAWTAGQVTVLATTAHLSHTNGDHLSSAVRAGEGEALFPQRAVHLEDWDEAQPQAWSALPVRELYAAGDLWPSILTSRLAADALLLAVIRGSAPTTSIGTPPDEVANQPDSLFPRVLLDRVAAAVRRFRQSNQIVGCFIPHSNAPALRPDLPREDLQRLSSEVVIGEEPLIGRIRALSPVVESLVVRHILVECAPADVAFARALVHRLHGARDRRGRAVEAWLSPATGRDLLELAKRPVGVFRNATVLMSRLLENSSGNRLIRAMHQLMPLLVGHRATTEFEVVVIESARPGQIAGFAVPLVSAGLDRRVLTRVIAVRSAAAEDSRFLMYFPASYAGEVRLSVGQTGEAAAASVADRLLALDLTPVDARAAVQRPDTRSERAPTGPSRRARVEMVGGFVVLAVVIGGALWFSRAPGADPPAAQQPPSPLQRALDLRNQRQYQAAIDVLTAAMRTMDGATYAAALRDRAYCFKLLAQWPSAITDLTTAIRIDNGASDGAMLKDRAFAYMKTRDLDAAIADYERLAQVLPADPAVETAALLRYAITSTRSPNDILFLYLPAGAYNDTTVIPAEAQRIGGSYFINLRFWWHTPYPDEVRYTRPEDGARASAVVKTLRDAGLKGVAGPTPMTGNVPRERRIEVWLMRRADPRGAAPSPPPGGR